MADKTDATKPADPPRTPRMLPGYVGGADSQTTGFFPACDCRAPARRPHKTRARRAQDARVSAAATPPPSAVPRICPPLKYVPRAKKATALMRAAGVNRNLLDALNRASDQKNEDPAESHERALRRLVCARREAAHREHERRQAARGAQD